MDVSKLSITKLSDDDKKSLVIFDCHNENQFKGMHHRKKNDIKKFCKKMNKFVIGEAGKDQVNGYSTTFLLKYEENKIVGYMSLCADGIRLDYNERRRSAIPYEMVPALKIARLAIDKSFQGNGLGEFLIKYAVYKLLIMRNETCGVKFITLDCFAHRQPYYDKIGFVVNLSQAGEGEIDSNTPISMRLHIEDYLEKNKSL